MKRASPHPDRARYPRSGMLILSGIMFLMYRTDRLVALVYIRQPLRHRGGAKRRVEAWLVEAPTLLREAGATSTLRNVTRLCVKSRKTTASMKISNDWSG